NGQLGDTGVQTLLYVVPNDVEVRVERHWLADNRLQFRMALLQRMLNEDDQRLNLQILRDWTHGRLQLDMQQTDANLRSEVRFDTQLVDRVRMAAVLWQTRCFTSG